jgi:hypothetical protein
MKGPTTIFLMSVFSIIVCVVIVDEKKREQLKAKAEHREQVQIIDSLKKLYPKAIHFIKKAGQWVPSTRINRGHTGRLHGVHAYPGR